MNVLRYIGLISVGMLVAFATEAQSLKAASEVQNNGVVKTQDSQKFLVQGIPFTMIYVKGGSFDMGATAEQAEGKDADENPVHKVALSSFYIGECEVTQELWQLVMGTTVTQQRDKANPAWPLRGEGAKYPMYYVNFNEVQEFIAKLNEMTGQNFALPTEAQWEYAARGGNKSARNRFSGDAVLENVGWFAGNANETNHPVAQKSANELGIYDMSGSVWEWCNDWYAIRSYSDKQNAKANPQGVASGEDMVLRGGCILTEENSCRNSNRGHMNPEYRNSFTGFRLVLVP